MEFQIVCSKCEEPVIVLAKTLHLTEPFVCDGCLHKQEQDVKAERAFSADAFESGYPTTTECASCPDCMIDEDEPETCDTATVENTTLLIEDLKAQLEQQFEYGRKFRQASDLLMNRLRSENEHAKYVIHALGGMLDAGVRLLQQERAKTADALSRGNTYLSMYNAEEQDHQAARRSLLEADMKIKSLREVNDRLMKSIRDIRSEKYALEDKLENKLEYMKTPWFVRLAIKFWGWV